MTLFEERRIRLRESLSEQKVKDAAIVIFANRELIRNNDVPYSFRQDTNFFYLTGFEEPDSVYIFRPGHKEENIMFVRKKDALKETWEGFRYGTEGARKEFFMDDAFYLEEFSTKAASLLKDCSRVYFDLFSDPQNDATMKTIFEKIKNLNHRSGRGTLPVFSSKEVIGEQRLFKSSDEVALLKKACEITTQGHIAVMKEAKVGMNERALHGVFLNEIMKQGSPREGYGGIFATGSNATTLHYVFNDEEMKDGELILVDAGAEHEFFTGDITRTFPVNGKFSDTQKRIYGTMLELQKSLVAAVKPGVTFKELNSQMTRGVTELLVKEGVLQGEVDELIDQQSFTKYIPHGVGHFLGMDVHDAGLTMLKGEPRPLAAGMALTIEPGIYIPADDEVAPKALRGLGIRIEDNILVTENGNINLTADCPKSIEELERS